MKHSDYEFMMSLGSWSRPYKDAIRALKGIEGESDGLIATDAAKGVLRVTCNGKGLRRDFAPDRAHGYSEFVNLDGELVLTLASITPKSELYHRQQFDNSIHFGIQLHGMEEIVPSINAADDNLMYLGAAGSGRNERILREENTFLAVDLSLSSLPDDATTILDVEAPNVIEILRDSVDESTDHVSYFSHDGAGGRLRQCANEMLHCDFEGQLRFDYLRAKANELLCLLELRSVKLTEIQPSPSYRLSQSDREDLEKVRLYVENNPAKDLSIENLSAIAGFSANRMTALFKSQYDVTLHQYVINSRMKKAKKLLSTTELPIKDICRAVGYSDLSGFGRAFKKTYGIRPTVVRRH